MFWVFSIYSNLGFLGMEERYEPLKDLGTGNFGVARLVKDKKSKELLAVKYIERGKKVKNELKSMYIYVCMYMLIVFEFF